MKPKYLKIDNTNEDIDRDMEAIAGFKYVVADCGDSLVSPLIFIKPKYPHEPHGIPATGVKKNDFNDVPLFARIILGYIVNLKSISFDSINNFAKSRYEKEYITNNLIILRDKGLIELEKMF